MSRVVAVTWEETEVIEEEEDMMTVAATIEVVKASGGSSRQWQTSAVVTMLSYLDSLLKTK